MAHAVNEAQEIYDQNTYVGVVAQIANRIQDGKIKYSISNQGKWRPVFSLVSFRLWDFLSHEREMALGRKVRFNIVTSFPSNEEYVKNVTVFTDNPVKVRGTHVCEDGFYKGAQLQAKEDLYVEFKSLAASNVVCERISMLCEKYLVAFRNSKGGRIYFGISDNGIVQGLHVTRMQEDKIRNEIGTLLHELGCDTRNSGIDFIQVYAYRFNKRGKKLHDVWVVRVYVRQGSKPIYQDSKNNIWMRYGGCVLKMPSSVIEERYEDIYKRCIRQNTSLNSELSHGYPYSQARCPDRSAKYKSDDDETGCQQVDRDSIYMSEVEEKREEFEKEYQRKRMLSKNDGRRLSAEYDLPGVHNSVISQNQVKEKISHDGTKHTNLQPEMVNQEVNQLEESNEMDMENEVLGWSCFC